MIPELIADYQCGCGEGPMWHPLEKRVYWVDIPTGRLFRYDPATGHHEMCFQGDQIGGFTIQEDGALLLFMNHGAIRLWRGGELQTLVEEIAEEKETRFNDVIADPEGRVFCGTMPTKERLGRLYRLDRDGSLRIVLEEVGCSNGMGFTPDRKAMYYTDSRVRRIYRFDYSRATGELSNQTLFVQTPEDEGVPDGMTVDAEGYVWTAKWDGSCLVRYAPNGTEERRVTFPAKQVSSVVFGGEQYQDTYVTTAGGTKKETNGPGAGALFRVSMGIRGVPEFYSRIAV
ncbi:SMP-30/gluconolactonase/LRE family protein [bacterium]|nr:SMP-30/gluconolactonase/LRE family protein [bacterium]